MSPRETDTLQQLRDIREIEQLRIRYCDAADQADAALMRAVFHPDATDEHASMFADPIDELVPKMMQMHERFSLTQHSLSNIVIAVDGDAADSRCQVTAHHRYEADGQSYHLIAGGHYVDRIERRDGAWRIARRVTHMDWSLTHRIEDGLPSPF